MTDTSKIHHINYEFSDEGLTPEQIKRHTTEVRAALAELFDISRDIVRFKIVPAMDKFDVRVMRAAGSTPDYDRNHVAFKTLMPMWLALHYKAKKVATYPAPYGSQAALIRVAVPLKMRG